MFIYTVATGLKAALNLLFFFACIMVYGNIVLDSVVRSVSLPCCLPIVSGPTSPQDDTRIFSLRTFPEYNGGL